jgi:hypothetical protein
MNRTLKTLAIALLIAAAVTLAVPMHAQAQIIVVQSPAPYTPPVVTFPNYPAYSAPTYVVPSYTYSAPTYVAPRVSYYSAPGYVLPRVSYYSAPAVTAYSAPIATTYSAYAAPVVTTPAAGVYTTYSYRNGLGLFRPRYVNQTYFVPGIR